MDTSKEYIKMCDCPEIQHAKTSLERDGHSFHVNLPHPKYGDNFKRITWLPRQDQIQEMMGKDHETTLDLLVHFYGFVTVDNPMGIKKIFDVSMEQLWLAFYMHERHKKKWDGKEWGIL